MLPKTFVNNQQQMSKRKMLKDEALKFTRN